MTGATLASHFAARADAVCAVIVTYQPELALLERVLDALLPQVGQVVIFDNGSTLEGFDAFAEVAAGRGSTLLRSPHNVGLATGFNRGIERARDVGTDFVLLLDQDSVLAPDAVAILLARWQELNQTQPVAAVGAQFHDPRSGLLGAFVRIGFPFNHKLIGGPGECIECDFLISSGCLIPIAVIDRVGAMDDALFIDNIDLDWSFRATAQGLRLYGVCDACMQHRIGDDLRPSRWIRTGALIHSPARLYYMMRNRVLLYRRRETPLKWIAQDVPRLFGKLARMSLLVAPRVRNLRAMCRGLWDGLRGRSGPAPNG